MPTLKINCRIYLNLSEKCLKKENDQMKELNERIRDLREDNDLKQSDIADYLGVTQQTYSNYETGNRDIPTNVVIQLAQFYKVSTDYLLSSNASYVGNVDMNAQYLGDVTLHDIVYDLQKLNKLNRKELVDYVHFLRLRK